MIKIYYRHDDDTDISYYLVFIEGSGLYQCESDSDILVRVANKDDGTYKLDSVTVESFAVSRGFTKAYEKHDDPLTKEWFNEFEFDEEMRYALVTKMRQVARKASYINLRRINLQDYLLQKFIVEILAL
jgi:hypothetical protein